jgi:CheY-like chemotaxis protein
VLPSSVSVDAESPIDEADLYVSADPVQLEQVMFNLCINARDAIDGQGRIRVRLQRAEGGWHCASCRARVEPGRWVALSVADTGRGVVPEALERLFEPFFSTKPVGHGSGMGLAMVHGIVHDHGGHIDVQTEAGAGTTFRVLLPATDAAPTDPLQAQPNSQRAVALPRLAGRVMLVEDDPMVGEFMVELIGSWGLDALLMRDPVAATAWLADTTLPLDLLITDQTMPGLTGIDLAQRACAARPGLPVLLYTGDADISDAADLPGSGVRAVVRKPIDADGLRALVKRWLVPAAG